MSAELQTPDTVETNTNAKRRRGTWLLILLILFLILFLLTTAILGSRLYDLTTRDQYTVDLGLGELDGSIELFRIEYSNVHNEITVQGSNGENVVAPGTTAEYQVRLRNNDEVVIDYVMTPVVEFFTEYEVPVEFRMADNFGNYILGSDTEWVGAADMNALAHKGSIHPGEISTYHVSWRWIFEVSDEQDEYDTFLGQQHNLFAPGVSVGIEMEATANSYATTKDITHVTHMLGQSFGCCWCCWLVWVLLLICVLLLAWIWWLRRKLSRLEETMEEYETLLQAAGLTVGAETVGQIYEQ